MSPNLQHLWYFSEMAFTVEEKKETFLGYDSFDLFQMSILGLDETCHTSTYFSPLTAKKT